MIDIVGNCNGEPSIYFTYDNGLIAERWVALNALENITQYVELKDKNGKEIYEGDILHHGQDETGGEMNEVIFQNGQFGMRWQSADLWHILCDSHYCEVIGNIYQNPELLKP